METIKEWWSYNIDLILATIATVIIATALITPLLYFAYIVDEKSCQETSEGMNINWKYSIVSSCRVELHDGRWIPFM